METPDPILRLLAELESAFELQAKLELAELEGDAQAKLAEAEFVAMQEAHDLHQAQQAAYDDAQWGL